MNRDYDACKDLYRAAWLEESSSPADRHAVRLALATAVAAGIHTAAAGASAASMAGLASVGGSGVQTAAAGVSAVGTKGILQLILGGKFLSGLLVGAVLGTAGMATAVAVRPNQQKEVAVERGSSRRSASPAHVNRNEKQAISADESAPQDVTPETLPSHGSGRLQDEGTPMPVTVTTSGLRTQLPTREWVGTKQHRLTEESQALANVQGALSRGDSNLALTLLDGQMRQFASGQLGEERSAARVLALCAAGRHVEAEAARDYFRATYPNSPLTKRVTLGCNLR